MAKRKAQKRVIVRVLSDKKGKYVLINGRKYRIGPKVTRKQIVDFVVKKVPIKANFPKRPEGLVAQPGEFIPAEERRLGDRFGTLNLKTAAEIQAMALQKKIDIQKVRGKEAQILAIIAKEETEKQHKKEVEIAPQPAPTIVIQQPAQPVQPVHPPRGRTPPRGRIEDKRDKVIAKLVQITGEDPSKYSRFSTERLAKDYLDMKAVIKESGMNPYRVDYTRDEPEDMARKLARFYDVDEKEFDDFEQKYEDPEQYKDEVLWPLAYPRDLEMYNENRNMLLGYIGSGMMDPKRGLSNFQIDAFMRRYPNYLGTIAHNEIPCKILPKVKPRSRGGFIINTDPASKPGQHWQAIYFDARPGCENEIDFFDSYGDPIDHKLQRDLKALASKLDAKTYLKLKENRICLQNDRSSNCGPFCIQFLCDRFRGKPFIDASGYKDSQKGEASVEKFKEQNGFGYIPSWGGYLEDDAYFHVGEPFHFGGREASDLVKLGGDLINFRTDYPPSVRKILENNGEEVIRKIQPTRVPIDSKVEAFINIISLGGLAKAKEKFGYSDMFHLYLWIETGKGNSFRLERNHVVEMYPQGPPTLSSKVSTMGLKVPSGLTVRQLLEKTKEAEGPNLQKYDAAKNNCQVFVRSVLKANGMWSPPVEKFVMQDAESVLKELPAFSVKIMKAITNFAHKGDVLIHGRKGLPLPPRRALR